MTRRIMAGVLLSMCGATAASGDFLLGPDWKEGSGGSGDAGSLPSTAQIPFSPLPFPSQLRTIAGELGSLSLLGGSDQQDLYAIYIDSPVIFQATTDSSADPLGFTSFDSQLFLFDAAGLPVVANDGLGAGATLALPTFALVPGVYYLAISTFNSDPLSASLSPLFPDLTGPMVLPLSPTAPALWTSSDSEGGTYIIALTGASFVPAPAALLLLAPALLLRRRRGSDQARGAC